MFTTSWDDGYADDTIIADLLEKYGCTGTFYICPKQQHGNVMLGTEQVRAISIRHEMGAHTIEHPHLTQVTKEVARSEIVRSKEWVEQQTGKPCTLFCYPYGDTNEQVAHLVQEAGFAGARTVEQFAFQSDGPFYLPTSLHVFPFPLRPVLNRRCVDPLRRAKPHLQRLNIPLYKWRGWLPLAKALFTHAYETNQPWFHLWGHSAEVKKMRMEHVLDVFLQFVSTHKDVEHAPNSAVLHA